MAKQTRDQTINNDFYNDLEEGWYTAEEHPIALLRAENATRIPWIMNTIDDKISSTISVLDIGCGGGFLTNQLSLAGHQVTGIDISKPSLEIAKKYDQTKQVTYMHADAYALPFEENSFDVVCAMDILEHIESPNTLIQEASRVLKPDGLFFFHTFNRNFLSYILVIKGVEWFVKNTPRNMHVYPLFIKPSELSIMLKESHFNSISMHGFMPHFFSLPFLKLLFTKKISPDFKFIFGKSLLAGYCGYAKKSLNINLQAF